MNFFSNFLCLILFAIGTWPPHTALEISSVLNLHGQYLLLFNKQGDLISLDESWCVQRRQANSKFHKPTLICPNSTSNFSRSIENASKISTLWDNSAVIGFRHVDASASFRNPFNHLFFLLLIQFNNSSDLFDYLVVNFSERSITAFGDAFDLFGSAWKKHKCLTRIVDIVTDRDESTTHFVLCKETAHPDSPHQVFRATVDLINFTYQQVEQFHSSTTQDSLLASLKTHWEFRKNADKTRFKNKTAILAIESWYGSMVIFHSDMFYIASKQQIEWASPVEAISSQIPSSDVDPDVSVDGLILKVPHNITFQLLQISIFLFSFIFIAIIFNLLWISVAELSDHFYEGVWNIKFEPNWLSYYDLMVH